MLDFSKNFFELFGLPQTLPVDTGTLSDRFHALQQALHPDRFAAAGEREKRLSMQASTRVNEAYQTLRDPFSGARYLLSLYTGETGTESKNTRDMDFLTEQMELREALAEAKSQDDPYAAVAAVMDRLAAQSERLLDQLTEQLRSPRSGSLEVARELVTKMQFVRKCQREAEQIEAELDDAL